jgi:GrpB-like predicted nucleotidyltransferase (UPF0157 family)
MRAIKVVDYDPSWPLLFAEMRAEVSDRLGDLLLRVEHIGSTAVPGLAAKPKIDLDAVMVSDAVLPAAIERMQMEDFAFHGDLHGAGRWAFTRDREGYGFRLYLCGPDNVAHRERILFRDYLRAHPWWAAEYAVLKRQLATEANGDWDFYTGGKGEFVRETVRLAEFKL